MSYLTILRRYALKIVAVLLIVLYCFIVLYVTDQRPFKLQENKVISAIKQRSYKYVLLWPNKYSSGFGYMREGDTTFVKFKCKHQNCFVTENRDYFHDLKEFDAVAFNGYEAATFDLPKDRSPKQKYIFASLESPDFYPACHKYLDSFFNLTWTYKLDSDFQWSYISIYDANGSFVGPAYDIDWVQDMEPIGPGMKVKLDKKSKAIAWLVSNCPSKRKREDFVETFREELDKFGWKVDIYGRCGNLSCPFSKKDVCFKMIEDDYHFYLAFENSFAEDYVTEKLLTAVNHYAIPIVYGAADYNRFLPPGSYLNAIELGPQKLAEEVNKILLNKTLYYDFFRWKYHYAYGSAHHLSYCRLCEALNNETIMNEKRVLVNFRRWWNEKHLEENCPNLD